MCRSLSKIYKVHYVVADGNGKQKSDGIDTFDIGLREPVRIKRMLFTTFKMGTFLLKNRNKYEVFHFHDPELLPLAIIMKILNKKVIFDCHEDLSKQVFSKKYLTNFQKKIMSKIVTYSEMVLFRYFDCIICATPSIRDAYSKYNKNTVTINNYPIINELKADTPFERRLDDICFLGGINEIRGVEEVVRSLSHIPGTTLQLAGPFTDIKFRNELEHLPEWKQVKYHDFVSRDEAKDIFSKVKIGVVTFHALPNHIEAQPNKLFEYMSAGLIIIGSNFPLWKEIIEGENCGICVDPTSVNDIAQAINFLFKNSDIAEAMSNNGINAVQTKYNWDAEAKKLAEIYKELLI